MKVSDLIPPVFLKIYLAVKSKILSLGIFKSKAGIVPSSRTFWHAYFDLGLDRFQTPFYVRLEDLRYFGGINYNSSHPFVSYYEIGLKALEDFYASHHPKGIRQKHFFEGSEAEDLDIDLPWYPLSRYASAECWTGEGGLEIAVHGVQHYGPVSEEKIKFEAKRLDDLLESFRKIGYEPKFDGFPRVYALERGSEIVFVVVGGQHRVATMAWLGWSRIPVVLSKSYAPLIQANTVANWPAVEAGLISQAQALEVFEKYFLSDGITNVSG